MKFIDWVGFTVLTIKKAWLVYISSLARDVWNAKTKYILSCYTLTCLNCQHILLPILLHTDIFELPTQIITYPATHWYVWTDNTKNYLSWYTLTCLNCQNKVLPILVHTDMFELTTLRITYPATNLHVWTVNTNYYLSCYTVTYLNCQYKV